MEGWDFLSWQWWEAFLGVQAAFWFGRWSGYRRAKRRTEAAE